MNDDAFDHMMKQITALTAISGSLLGLWSALLAVPAAVYYLILIIEKATGKKLSELISKKDKK